uniref:Uncharacterized protein n=1 Tax=Rousettus aegyptiacus TaxID=9407 RepID=A0A7J8GWK3_ROUAE|nr:hypothetical protein HJG63_001894 [Rousettus aegyptiacus]
MARNLASVAESFPSEENATTQQSRPSVTWALSSPTAPDSTAQATTSSRTYPASAFFRRDRLGSRPEVRSVGTQPQTCFLRPRMARPLVLFRQKLQTRPRKR